MQITAGDREIDYKRQAHPLVLPSLRGDCAIKENINSKGEKIYHVPGRQFYDRAGIDMSKGERCFYLREEGEAAGWHA